MAGKFSFTLDEYQEAAVKYELTPKSWTKNFWGAVQNLLDSLFCAFIKVIPKVLTRFKIKFVTL